jgi:hypothetical protein
VILRRFVGLLLAAAILALAPAAHASPPDQSWISGLYDNADFDDVVLLITSNLGAIQPPRLVIVLGGPCRRSRPAAEHWTASTVFSVICSRSRASARLILSTT